MEEGASDAASLPSDLSDGVIAKLFAFVLNLLDLAFKTELLDTCWSRLSIEQRKQRIYVKRCR